MSQSCSPWRAGLPGRGPHRGGLAWSLRTTAPALEGRRVRSQADPTPDRVDKAGLVPTHHGTTTTLYPPVPTYLYTHPYPPVPPYTRTCRHHRSTAVQWPFCRVGTLGRHSGQVSQSGLVSKDSPARLVRFGQIRPAGKPCREALPKDVSEEPCLKTSLRNLAKQPCIQACLETLLTSLPRDIVDKPA